MAENTPGRKKTSRAKKAIKPPIPIDGGVSPSSPAAPVLSREGDNTATNESFPGVQEEIRLRAYALYEARGRRDGFQEEDWMRAETEILAKYRGKSA